MDSAKQGNNKERTWPVHLWKKGQSGNPAGRPKGKTLKEWAKERLAQMNEDERDIFMEGLPKYIVWQMAEGNPETKQDIKIDKAISFTEEEIEAAKQFIIGTRLNKDKGITGDSSGETKS